MHNTGIIILAAGSSSRLGRPKQSLPFKGKALLQHIIDEAITAELSPIIVVLGANAQEILKTVNTSTVIQITNSNWQSGMASGIVAGLSAVQSLALPIHSIILAVCDQPYISADLLQQLINKSAISKKGIIASAYAGTSGTPILFNASYFPQLLQLTGEEGAKKLIRFYSDDVETVPFEKGEIDIDTELDYEHLLKEN